MLHFRGYSDMAEAIHRGLPMIAAQEFDLIVGIPRSGMIPAYMIALDLNIMVCTFYDFIDDAPIKKFSSKTRKVRDGLRRPSDAKKVLLIDDSYNTGQTLKELAASLPANLRKKVTTMAVYSVVEDPDIDLYLEVVPQPRVFEWNIFHHERTIGYSCFDLDGVLCEDPAEEQNDDDKKYLHFIKNAKPKFVPTYKIKAIVTSRLEKYRRPTEAWLRKHGVMYEKLIMLDGYTAEERKRKGLHAPFKAAECRKEEYGIFFESSLTQAKIICKVARKPVYCTETNEMLYPEPEPLRLRARLKEAVKRRRWARALLVRPYRLYRRARVRTS